MIAAACGSRATPEEYRARFVEARWSDVTEIDTAVLAAGLQAYVDGDDPAYPQTDERLYALHEVLYRTHPDPAAFLPLLGPHPPVDDVDARLLKRDGIALAVTTSFMRRIAEDPADAFRAALYDALVYAGRHFSFDPAYGDSHPATAPEISDFFMAPEMRPCAESRASMERGLEETIAAWRGRATEKASTTFFSIVLRHLGVAGGERLFSEWPRMSENERVSLLRLAAEEEEIGPRARATLVEALLDGSFEVREAAFDGLRRCGAPTEGLEAGLPERDLRRHLPALRRWAEKADS